MRPQEDGELAFQLLIVEVEKLVAPRAWASGACSYSSSRVLTTTSRLAERRGWMGAGARISSSSTVTKKSRLPKRTCMPGVELMPWLAIHGLMRTLKRAKGPYLVCQLSVFWIVDE
jgi:hypothetical protein